MHPGPKSGTLGAMTEWLILLLLVPAVVVPVVLLAGFAGCTFEAGIAQTVVLKSADGTSESAITLTWTWNGAAGVTFEYERTKGGTTTILPATSSLSHDDTGLDPATSYDYRVRVVFSDAPGGWSNMVTGTTLASTAVTKSLIFTAANLQALTRSWDAGGSRTQWTFSTWFKRSSVGAYHVLFSCWTANDDTNYLALYLNSSDNKLYVAGWNTNYIDSGSAVISDTTTWHHVVVACDTPNATADNRIKLYLDGVDVTTVSNNPGAGANLGIGQDAIHRIGVGDTGSAGYFDGKLADTYFVDGSVLDHASFAGNGHPKK